MAHFVSESAWRSTCCNPFQIEGHTARKNSLRPVSQWMCEKSPLLHMGMRICDTCRKKLAQASALTVNPQGDSTDSTLSESLCEQSETEDPSEMYEPSMMYKPSEQMGIVNQCLLNLGETPVTKRKLQSKKYCKQKMEVLTMKMGEVMIGEKQTDESEMLQQLKEKFHSTPQNSIKVQILTVLPKSWSIQRIQMEFGASNFMARKAKQLVKDKGVLSSPDPRPGRQLPQEVLDHVAKFYENDKHSRCMPGKKDFVSVLSANGRIHVQKRLILCNLKELYQHFKMKYPQQHIGFSKFAELRPKHCILAGASGTHSVCVCIIHQNVKLMLLGAKIQELDSALPTYHRFLAKLVCNPPHPNCYLGDCKFCPGIESV